MLDNNEGRNKGKNTSPLKSYVQILIIAGFVIFQLYSNRRLISPYRYGNAPNETLLKKVTITINVTEHPNRQPKVYFCQNLGNGIQESLSILSSVFPEYQHVSWEKLGKFDWWKIKKDGGNAYDLFLTSIDGVCENQSIHKWLIDVYEGKILYTSGEDSIIPRLRDNLTYVLGPIADLEGFQSMRLYYLQMVFWFYLHKNDGDNKLKHNDDTISEDNIYNPRLKPRSTGQHFLMYAQSNCAEHREAAYDELSKLGLVHYGGRCKGNVESPNKTAIRTGVSLRNWFNNVRTYHDYRFCLVMEHNKKDGYVTEKILLSYLAGCIPIYYGSTEIFDLFNPDAFIYYDIDDPKLALNRIQAIEGNRTMYDWVTKQPILAHGEKTLQDYFSFSDDVGGGVLKRRIRQKLDLDHYHFTK